MVPPKEESCALSLAHLLTLVYPVSRSRAAFVARSIPPPSALAVAHTMPAPGVDTVADSSPGFPNTAPEAREAKREAAKHEAMAKKPPSSVQLGFLKGLGYDGPTPENMLQASELIDQLKRR
jgi:hypothetical protein